MLFLAAALLLLGTLMGTAAFIPPTATAAGAAAIAVWLLVFAVRERTARPRRAGSQAAREH
ncbi:MULTISPECIES: hypothetical protein [Streptomyces]|uniref:Small hydrophobic membrane protein n=2 Tax=Streptomyces TaxID=1883 RepID=A0A1D8G6U9_9ACTN|nr:MULTISPECIES: hypothetical protein [Streptomyces]AOT61174.1 hypothetical protein A4G23_04052 [Streptomyces rubrolavendulae]KAF0650160.1 hypothetical protein K701_10265 [Streptomyces fradiae ATCC 10745 = DSM 40063]OSY51946.1 hypothetical protein BG846_02408 [Streptomyces fradiae ATCC 10745 = DSM 40063]QEV14200.1 hypothetical protein CP974_21910 [Streptomyces fradiae ATCC 10745 = DSM 40063]UQS30570.1 hypothetical protein J5J01_02045 [Streptomyces fradiae]